MSACFGGLDNFGTATVIASTFTGNTAGSGNGLAASANPAVVGQAVTFTATVRGPGGSGTPTDTVTFFVGSLVVARVTLDANGQARLRRSFSLRGLFTIRAVYSGDANFAASSQSLTAQVI